MKTLTAGVAIIIGFGMLAANEEKVKAVVSAMYARAKAFFLNIIHGSTKLPESFPPDMRIPTKPEVRAAGRIIQVIRDAKYPTELDKVFGLLQDFRVEFSGKIPDREINEYCFEILKYKREVRAKLLGDLIKRSMAVKDLSTVS